MRRDSLVVCLLFVLAGGARAQSSPAKLQPNLDQLSGWVGEWHCDGKFVKTGKAISSSIGFAPTLEGRWIEVHQDDEPPNAYHAVQLWSYDDKESRFVATIFDNFSATPRTFDGVFSNGTPTWKRSIDRAAPISAEQFVFETKGSKLAITYQVIRKGESAWSGGDVLDCSRK